MITSRRARISRISRIGQAANEVAERIRSGKPMRLPLDLAVAVDALVQAADAVGHLADEELRFLEESRDWGEGA